MFLLLFFLPCFPTAFSPLFILFFSLLLRHAEVLVDLSAGGIYKRSILEKKKKIEAMSLGMPVFHNGGKRYLNFLLNMKQ